MPRSLSITGQNIPATGKCGMIPNSTRCSAPLFRILPVGNFPHLTRAQTYHNVYHIILNTVPPGYPRTSSMPSSVYRIMLCNLWPNLHPFYAQYTQTGSLPATDRVIHSSHTCPAAVTLTFASRNQNHTWLFEALPCVPSSVTHPPQSCFCSDSENRHSTITISQLRSVTVGQNWWWGLLQMCVTYCPLATCGPQLCDFVITVSAQIGPPWTQTVILRVVCAQSWELKQPVSENFSF